MAISLNTDTQTNTLAANSNLALQSGISAPTETTSTLAPASYGPAVIITLSANAELSLSQVADEYPDAPSETVVVRPPPTEPPTPGETVVVRGTRPYFTPNFIFSNSGWNDTTSWAETNGENMPDNTTRAPAPPPIPPPAEPKKPDEIVTVIANKLAPPPPVKDGKDPAFEYALEKIFNGQNGGVIDALYEGPDLVHTSPGPDAPKPVFTPPTSLPRGYTPVGDQGKFMKGEDGKIYFTNEYATFMQDAHAYGMTDWNGFWLDMAGIGFGMAAWEVIGAKNIGLLFGGALLEYIRGGHQER